MSKHNYRKYDEDFKKQLVSQYQQGVPASDLCKEYGVSSSTFTNWTKQYATIETGDGQVFTAKEVGELLKQLARLTEENHILKKAIAIFTPPSVNDSVL